MSEAKKASTWYRLHGNRLKPVEVHRHTESSVWIEDRFWSGVEPKIVRKQRQGSFDRFFPTAEEGIAFIRKRLTNAVERAKRNLERDKSALGQFESAVKSYRVLMAADVPIDPNDIDFG